MREKCELFLRQATSSPSSLSAELQNLVQATGLVYSMCCIYLEKYVKHLQFYQCSCLAAEIIAEIKKTLSLYHCLHLQSKNLQLHLLVTNLQI